MATVLLISINDVNAEGLRTIAAYLASRGHRAPIIFLQRTAFPANKTPRYAQAARRIMPGDWIGVDEAARPFAYGRGPDFTDEERVSFISLLDEIAPDVVGLSVTSPQQARAAVVSSWVRAWRRTVPIVWGGMGPALAARECLAACDAVCIGEGEEALAAVAEGIERKEEWRSAPGIAVMTRRGLRGPSVHGFAGDLDSLPVKDIDAADKYLIEQGTGTVRSFGEISYYTSARGPLYHVMTARGCPCACTFCGNYFYKRLYASRRYYRRRSPRKVIDELLAARERVGYQGVYFEDDIFLWDHGWIRSFLRLYRRSIRLPFISYIYPHRDYLRLLPRLREAGLLMTTLSLQSGSERINRDVFRRPFDRALYLRAARLLHRLGVKYSVDVITYTPFEREEDLRATHAVLSALPKPFELYVNKLYCVPGMPLYPAYRRALRRSRSVLPERLFDVYTRFFFRQKYADRCA